MATPFSLTPLRVPSEDPVQRGKKATIKLEEADDDDDDETYKTFMESNPSRSPSQDETSRLRSMMERIVSNPVVAFFTCSLPQSNGASPPNNPSMLRFFRSSNKYYTHYFQTAMQAGAPKAIVQTMKQFPYQCRIQRLGCGALRDMAVDSWPMKTQVVEAGSVETILKAMRIHLKDAKLQEIACKCLYELVAGDLPAILVERGVVATLLQTMEQHAQDEDVLPVACNVLLALTDSNIGAVECLRHRLGGVVLAKLEHSFRGQNGEISRKAGELLRRLYL